MLGVGVIGAGRHGERYLRHLARGEVPGAALRGFWRRDAERGTALAGELGVRFEPDLGRLVEATDVDLLIAAVPVALHAHVAERVAAAQKPLLLEKPIAGDLATAARMEAAFQRAGRPLMVAQTLRFDPLVTTLRRRAAALGALAGFTFEQRIEPRGLPWEDEPQVALGGVLLQTAIHTVDALRFVTSATAVAVVAAHLSRFHNSKNEDQALCLLEVETPLTARAGLRVPGTIGSSKVGQARTVRFALHHEGGTLEADLIRRTLVVCRGRTREEEVVPEIPTVAAAAAAFVAVVRGDAPNPVPASEAMAALEVVEAAYRAARQ